MQVIANGYDLSIFRPNVEAGHRVRSELGLDSNQQVIGFVARYDPHKDHRNLLQAMSILKSQHLAPACLLVGTGMEHGNTDLTRQIAELDLKDQIHLLGSRADIADVMNALDLHVMSSISEAFPNVLCEAMACGIPCVSTDVGDAAAIIGITGLIVPPRNPEALARAIKEMLEEKRASPSWPVRQESARRHIVNHFSIQRMVDSYRAVWFEKASECEDKYSQNNT